jgi:signal transduction histidine kinase/ActR/RegA family two-component response regulator
VPLLRHLTFDDGYDETAAGARRTTPSRMVMTVILAGVMGANLGWATAACWFLVAVAGEMLHYFASPPPERITDRLRMLRLAAIFAIATNWTVGSALYWQTGDRALQVVAIAQLSSFVMTAMNYSFQSVLATVVCAFAPLVALVLLPVFDGRFTGVRLATVCVAFLLTPIYVFVIARTNVDNGAALRRTREALLAKHAALEDQTELAVAASHAKSAFLAMMSHELRTPMNGVLGMAHALGQTDLDARQAGYVDMLLRSGEGLMAILNDLLDISKIEAGKLELEAIPFDLGELGQRTFDLWAETAAAKGLKFTYTLDPSAPRWVTGDPTRLRQVMVNLVSNALKFTAEGEVRLWIRRPSSSERRAVIEIGVADTGPGMDRDQQAKLFQAFTQADTSTTRKFGGTGLGLAICRQLVRLMGGEIWVESEPGRGATFRARVELAVADAPAAATEAGEAEPGDAASLRVLVADDNAINLAVARTILESVGVEVVTAGDGAEALDELRRSWVDVVLMDVHMPGMDGVEALTRIRAGETGRPEVPVIALTADAMAGVEADLLARGFDAVEAKPVKPGQLIGAILAASAAAPAPLAESGVA